MSTKAVTKHTQLEATKNNTLISLSDMGGLGLHSAALFGETNTANANAPYGGDIHVIVPVPVDWRNIACECIGMCTGPPTALQNNAGCNFTTAVYSGALPQFLETLSTPPDGFEAYQCTLYKVTILI